MLMLLDHFLQHAPADAHALGRFVHRVDLIEPFRFVAHRASTCRRRDCFRNRDDLSTTQNRES